MISEHHYVEQIGHNFLRSIEYLRCCDNAEYFLSTDYFEPELLVQNIEIGCDEHRVNHRFQLRIGQKSFDR